MVELLFPVVDNLTSVAFFSLFLFFFFLSFCLFFFFSFFFFSYYFCPFFLTEKVCQGVVICTHSFSSIQTQVGAGPDWQIWTFWTKKKKTFNKNTWLKNNKLLLQIGRTFRIGHQRSFTARCFILKGSVGCGRFWPFYYFRSADASQQTSHRSVMCRAAWHWPYWFPQRCALLSAFPFTHSNTLTWI